MLYADYNGSAPLLSEVKEFLKMRLESDLFANPNALHSMGQKLGKGMEKSRAIIADAVGAHPDQIIFTSGSSESCSTVIHSVLEYSDKKIVITSPLEHPSVGKALNWYAERRGIKVLKTKIDRNGVVDVADLKELLEKNKGQVALVTIMSSQNETGVIEPNEEIAALCREHHVPYFPDTTQFIGKTEFHFEKSGADYAVCSGHKLGALSGTGFIVAKDPTLIHPLVFGSTQEKGLRGGTQHYLGIETLAIAFAYFKENSPKLKDLEIARDWFEKEIKKACPKVVIIGEGARRLPGTSLIGYPGLHGQAIQIELESNDVFVTTSAACVDNQPETSKVLKEMGVTDEVGRSVIRISLSTSHGQKNFELLLPALKNAYNKLSRITSY
ncbi:MAG: cysteine desulfurase family protein [Bacteriovoracaceae bacterium]